MAGTLTDSLAPVILGRPHVQSAEWAGLMGDSQVHLSSALGIQAQPKDPGEVY